MTLDYAPRPPEAAERRDHRAVGARSLFLRMRNTAGSRLRPVFELWLAILVMATVLLPACVPQGPGARGPYPELAEYEGMEVRRVEFMGDLELPADSLREVIVTRPTQCWLVVLPICLPFNIGRDVQNLDLEELARDVVRLQLYFRDHGYYGTRIAPSVDELGSDEVVVRFAIAPGDRVVLTDLEVSGAQEALDSDDVEAMLPLQVGEPFGRRDFLRSADTIRHELWRRGHAYAEVLRNYALDTIADVAQAQFIAIPGPIVEVDSIIFAGGGRLTERTLRRQMPVREGGVLQVPQLAQSQRELHRLAMVSFASVEIAPDSLQLNADSSTATVLVRVIEAPQYVVDASLGIGTVECLRSEARWVDRNFLGGGRTMEVTGLLSRIGVGEPLNFGFDQNICGGANQPVALGPDTDLLRYLNYRVAAQFEQPRLLNTRNELTVDAHWERLTELNAYLRESTGAEAALSREIGRNRLLNVTLAVEHGRTRANPVVFCVGFDICSALDVQELQRFRWSNSLSATTIWDRTRVEGTTSRGYSARASVDWASAALASDNEYLRVLGEGAAYWPLQPGWVLAGNLRLGSFLQGQLGLQGGYIPPERRFYAGGPNSVRGFGRNMLGPTAYVRTETVTTEGVREETVRSAVGGTQMVVASTELRMPSPFYSQFFRLAAFVDAGQVWAPGSEVYRLSHLAVTPGVGLRVATPVGPMRLDVAYNAYPHPAGPLYFVDPASGDLLLEDLEHRPPDDRSFWRRLEFSFAVGQAF